MAFSGPRSATESIRTLALVGAAGAGKTSLAEALLVASGAVEASYVDAMHERETSVSTHMGNLLAIPHGTNDAKSAINRSAISFIRYPDGIDWNGKPAEFVIGIAGAGDDHLTVLQALAGAFTDDASIAALDAAQTPDDVLAVLGDVSA